MQGMYSTSISKGKTGHLWPLETSKKSIQFGVDTPGSHPRLLCRVSMPWTSVVSRGDVTGGRPGDSLAM